MTKVIVKVMTRGVKEVRRTQDKKVMDQDGRIEGERGLGGDFLAGVSQGFGQHLGDVMLSVYIFTGFKLYIGEERERGLGRRL